MKKKALVLVLIMGSSVCSSRLVADELWKCKKPVPPARFASTEEEKNVEPPCEKWVKVRGVSSKLAEALATPFRKANEFIARVAEVQGREAPTVSTKELYRSPESYGYAEATIEAAPLGSIVVYDGLGGVLVEIQEEESGVWERAVLYPSAARDFSAHIASPEALAAGEAKVLVEID